MATEELYLLDGFLMIIDGSDLDAPQQVDGLHWLPSGYGLIKFEATTVEREWIVERTGRRRIVDRDICCAYVDEKTGTKCDWKTTDSARQTSDQEGEYDNPAAPGKEYSPPFTVVQDPDFKQIFLSLATHDRSVARCNSLPVLAIIGHWMKFEYRQQNSRNLTAVKIWLPRSILALDLVPKLLSIAGANADNSESMFSNLHRRLPARIGLRRKRDSETEG
ncbi:hypothetical protein V8E54_004800 [Elaphomyces granulatus]